MKLSDLAPIASLVSAVAVLISLIYLSLQLRQGQRNQRAAVNQTILDRHVRITEWLRLPPLAELHFRAVTGETDFSDAELSLMLGFVQALGAQGLDAWVQRRSNLIDEPTFAMAMGSMRLLLSIPAYRAIWPLANRIHGDDFGRFTQTEILSGPLLEPAHHQERYRENLRAVLGG
jgi:hypothetical protein